MTKAQRKCGRPILITLQVFFRKIDLYIFYETYFLEEQQIFTKNEINETLNVMKTSFCLFQFLSFFSTASRSFSSFSPEDPNFPHPKIPKFVFKS